jgi:hypothetical protein
MDPTFKAEPDQEVEKLLEEIEAGAEAGARSPSRTTTFAIAPFAALLVRLSRDADKTANKVVRLTWGLFWLTLALLIFTGYLAWKEATKS